MSGLDALLLVAGGLAAGVINAMAGGGSLITVPLLVVVGLDGDVANGSNRIGVLGANASSARGFAKAGVDGFAHSKRILVPIVLGGAVGAAAISQVESEAFERLFGLVMIPLLVLTLFRRRPEQRPEASAAAEKRRGSGFASTAIYLGVGLYGGAFQAGVGLLLVAALAREGMDLVTANAVKVMVTFGFTAVAIPIFIATGKIDWPAATVLAIGFIAGGAIGARVAVRGGERLIRPVLAVAVVALAGRMLGLY